MPKKILIIEDNAKNRTILKDILSFHKYEVIEAEDGKAGIELAKQEHPDLIFMDIQMPVMDGFTAGKILKTMPETKNIKLFALTSFAMKSDQEKSVEIGFDDYITKPFELKDLINKIRNAIGQ